MPVSPSETWETCLQAIKGKIQPQTYATWFSGTSCLGLTRELATIAVPSAFFADWLHEHYAWLIQAAIEDTTSWRPSVRFSVSPGEKLGAPDPDVSGRGIPASPSTGLARVDQTEALLPNSRYCFERFVVGRCNEFPLAAARSVAESPGLTDYNPLVISSGVGLGKTHLLQAIGEFSLRHHPSKSVVYSTAENFISEYINSIRNGDTRRFVRTYRSADLLLIDDIQFFLQTEGSQREFFHTFNALYQNDRQIVLTSDAPPSALKGFEDRLLSRFQSGLVAVIDPPDLETRMAVLSRKSEERGVDLPEDACRFLAESISTNVRELEGALTRLLAIAGHRRTGVSLDLAQETLIAPRRRVENPISLESIQERTARFFEVSLDQLVGPTRKQEVAEARHVGMYLCKSLTGASLKRIGKTFGNRDHSTVIHACRAVKRKLADSSQFGERVSELSEEIRRRFCA